MVCYKGWIIGVEEDRRLLRTLGIVVIMEKQEIEGKVEFDVNGVTVEILSKLGPYWGRLIWGLTPYER